ncbi:MAG: hypothetical protein ABL973_15130 [Micropepsaceae bacterium]
MHRSVVTILFFCSFAAGAFAFGVEPGTHNLGSEHEKITRSAIKDLDPETLNQLAGSGEEPGAVGMPDDPERGLLSSATNHCDGGDFLPQADAGRSGYAQSSDAAQFALKGCRDNILSHLNDAIGWAGALSTATNESVEMPCRFNGKGSSAKCNVLEHLGLAFHAAQDFYARTNWVDEPAKGLLSASNPPGLGQSGRARWLDPRLKEPFPEGLISGCPGDMRVLGITFGCEYGALPPLVGNIRVLRKDLSKDTGPVGSGAGGIGTSPRGRINGNFARAVSAAIEDTSDKWSYFKEMVVKKYGRARGAKILCVLRRDGFDPKACAAEVAQKSQCSDRERISRQSGDDPVDEGVYREHFVVSPDELAKAETLYDTLKSSCVIEETDITRAFVTSGNTADNGRATARSSAVQALAVWGSCRVELVRNLPEMEKLARDGYHTEISKPKTDPKVEIALLTRIYSNCVLGAHLQKSRR